MAGAGTKAQVCDPTPSRHLLSQTLFQAIQEPSGVPQSSQQPHPHSLQPFDAGTKTAPWVVGQPEPPQAPSVTFNLRPDTVHEVEGTLPSPAAWSSLGTKMSHQIPAVKCSAHVRGWHQPLR